MFLKKREKALIKSIICGISSSLILNSLIVILFLYVFKVDIVAYIFVGILTLLQTIAAFGYCSAQKLYECLVLGKNCCNLGKKIRGGSCNVR